MIKYFLIVFGNSSTIVADLTILLGDEIVRMVEGDSVILITLNSEAEISKLKTTIMECNAPFILIPKDNFKDLALNIEDDTMKYLFNTKVTKKPVIKTKETQPLTINGILDKINKTGVASLKKEEKEFLEKNSVS
jgi:hypothetical protein